MIRRIARVSTAARIVTAVSAAQSLYLAGLCIAAKLGMGSKRPFADRLRLAVLVPAHDEASVIVDAVDSLTRCAYPADRREIIVVADNCSDETAPLARDSGATVWERDDQAHPGKGRALAWALSRLATERPALDAVVMMDADCVADVDLLRGLAGMLATGADAAQGAFLGSNPDLSPTAALRWAGYALMNVVRAAGQDALGASSGLFGSGMAFSAATLAAVPWDSFSVTEDKEQHLRLVWSGRRVRFAPTAIVRSPMPTKQLHAETQQTRWETGNVQLARTWAPALLSRGCRERDRQLLLSGWDLLVPPLSLLVAQNAAIAVTGLVFGDTGPAARARRTLLITAAYVVGGLAAVKAPRSVFQALLYAPLLIIRRLSQYSRVVRGRGHREWARTTRESAPDQVSR